MTVDSWFSNYVSENINIDSEKSTGARNSRNWLTSNIKYLSQKSEENLELFSDSEFSLKRDHLLERHRLDLLTMLTK